ncbi:MAG: tRNA (N(6)-L-threonylcarbamoyladenosine(37)-C(2))-methylthiotransferase MtaB [Candidatus Rokubacteria bacterium]|nr:tRNA (N(6)-L-threonylcarbamoyladenosine(37)-C(2))-methylthiotransferase MtaB [Candidatus Rokubacteria bacterium]
MSTVAFATLGCRLNQVDTQEMKARLEARGFETVPFETRADVVVVNSCTVTARADFSDRQMVRRAAREHPGARVVVTGCWAQTNPTAAVATGADLVVGNADKHRIADLVESLLADASAPPRIAVSDLAGATTIADAPLATTPGRSRAFLKVQEGCQHRCAFCIVPLARGASRSQRPDVVVAQVRRLVDAGHPEVVLTGVDLGHYGADLTPRTTLATLLRDLETVPGLRWLRLSSILPAYVTAELLDVIAGSAVVAPHFHIPLQSGSDRVLRGMRRPYSVRMYRDVVERLAARVPGLGLGADVIVGFPGETDADFAATVRLVDELPFSYLHVFAYSDRTGTEAATRPGRVDPRTIARRSAVLRARSGAKARAFREALVGRTVDALVLETRDRATGGLVGLTGSYVEVVFDGPDSLMRRLVRARVTDAGAERARGEAA